MSLKLIISDVDGTLIDQTESQTEALKKLEGIIKTKQLPFTLASGRSPEMLNNFIQQLNIQLPVIVNNGASALFQGKPIWSDLMDPLHIKQAILEANAMNLVVIMGDGVNEVVYRHNAYVQNQIEKFGRYNRFFIPLESDWPNLKLQKVLIIDPEPIGRIDKVIDKLIPFSQYLNIVRYNSRSIDIMPRRASKGQALIRLAEFLGVDVKDIMAIGDAQNDIEMLRIAGVGVAVNNASNDLKQIADYVCRESNALGVIEAIERFCVNL